MRVTRYLVTSEPFVDEAFGHTKRILFATRTASILVLDEASWRRLEGGLISALPAAMVEQLVQAEVLVPDGEDELAEILRRNDGEADQDDQLYLVIQPTAQCQLGCDYCGQSHANSRLSPEDQDKLVDRVLRKLDSKRYRSLFIAWFGAEPLAGLAVIRSLTGRLRDAAEAHQCRFGAKMITNGLALSHAIASEIVGEHDVKRIEITLDGASTFHDARRHRKNGAGTFEQIFGNLRDLALRRDLKVQVSVRCNVDRRNVDGVLPLLRALADAGLQERISFYTTPVYSWGNDAHRLSLSPEEYAVHEVNWLAEMLLLGFVPALVPRRKPVVCLATMPNAELVDAYGNLFNCTEVSYVPAYGVPNRYMLGTLRDGTSIERRNLLGDFNARVARQEYPCASCRMLPVCGGACPKKWQEGFVPCPSAKWNINERLLLEFARLRMPRGGAQPPPVAAVADASAA
jgi:uncharacterized protein